jgi:4-diphosphocytidyl-2-C-methyl-D-erythritol kinase
MDAVLEHAPAKVNLVLRVGERRPDGYHEVVSLMARVDLADRLSMRRADRTVVRCPALPEGDTLVTRALVAFGEATSCGGGFHVTVHKEIPVGAGLGGGSSDAAAALRAANRLCGDVLAPEALMALAATIGSDVPFFLGPPAAIVRGRGEMVEPVPPLPAAAFAIAHPGRPLATRDVYQLYRPSRALGRELAVPAALDEVAALVENDLGPVAERLEPACGAIRRALLDRGALAASVSGSGSAVFGVFTTTAAASAAIEALPGATWSRTATLSAP